MVKTHLPDQETLSTEFRIILREWLTQEQLESIDRMNAAESNGSCVCHTHDFCDSNQAMLDALERFGVEYDTQDERQSELINAAWDIAKRKGFA